MSAKPYYRDQEHIGRKFVRTNGVVVTVTAVSAGGDWKLTPFWAPPGIKGRASWKWGPHVEILEELPRDWTPDTNQA